MITRDNLKFYFEDLNEEQANEIQKPHDYILCELSIFNAGAVAHATSQDYCEKTANEAADSGNMLIDKDDFLRLYEESGAKNPHIDNQL